jgi:hypothetical protein
MMRGDGVVRGIVLATVLTVALEVGLLGLNGVDVNPLHIGAAQAQAADGDFPPDTSIDCDNDKDGGTDFGESAECLFFAARDWFSANQDLIFYSLAGLAVGVGIISGGLLLVGVAPELFGAAGLLAAYGIPLTYVETAAGITAVANFSSQFYVLTTAIGALSFVAWDEFAYLGEAALPGSRARDARASDIALPEAVAVRVPTLSKIASACRRVKHKALCRRVARAARTYALSLTQTVSVSGALAVTVKRLRHAGTDPGRQTGTAKVLALRLLNALTAQQAAARAYARELRRAHVNLRLSVAQVRRVLAAVRNLKGIPKAVLRQLEQKLELSAAQLKQLTRRALARTIPRPKRFDFIKELERPLPVTGLRETYESLTVGEMARLLNQLNYEKRIGNPDALTLMNDLLVAQRACTPQQRRGPMGQFAADVRAHVHGPYAQFLQEAAVPLLGNHPYPKNKPPTAGFTPAQITQRAFPGHPLQANFIDISNDKADGGHVGCYEWNFGDPSSGASNVSFERNPTHNYAQPGNYTVTLTAIDDDGFASNTTTGHVTATP